ncbi:DedA family protein [Streptomyces sp. Edi2]|uniref:DedA family protein n=1 Tax=Streptomyces sp. Edi2 TaxID=3162528 RepID=UPI0033058C5B
MSQALNPLDATSLLTALGAAGVFLVLFAETGLLNGFFLPGDSLLFTAGLLCTTRSRHLLDGAHRAEELLARYGRSKAIVPARFIPVVRTLLNPLVGVVRVPARTFAVWQVTGGLVWTAGLVLGGYALGSSVPDVDRYLLPLVGLIVTMSLLPLALEALRARRRMHTVTEPPREAAT